MSTCEPPQPHPPPPASILDILTIQNKQDGNPVR